MSDRANTVMNIGISILAMGNMLIFIFGRHLGYVDHHNFILAMVCAVWILDRNRVGFNGELD